MIQRLYSEHFDAKTFPEADSLLEQQFLFYSRGLCVSGCDFTLHTYHGVMFPARESISHLVRRN